MRHRIPTQSATAPGYAEYGVKNRPGNEFSISCDIGATDNHENTSISIRIVGKTAPRNSHINIVLDGDEIGFGTDEGGRILG
jgi:hypothetical protein